MKKIAFIIFACINFYAHAQNNVKTSYSLRANSGILITSLDSYYSMDRSGYHFNIEIDRRKEKKNHDFVMGLGLGFQSATGAHKGTNSSVYQLTERLVKVHIPMYYIRKMNHDWQPKFGWIFNIPIKYFNTYQIYQNNELIYDNNESKVGATKFFDYFNFMAGVEKRFTSNLTGDLQLNVENKVYLSLGVRLNL